MLYVPGRVMKSFPGGFLVSISLLGTDLECLIKFLEIQLTHTDKKT